MLKPLALHKVRLMGRKAAQERALRLWQQLGVLHLVPIPLDQAGLQPGRALESYDTISEQLVRLRAIKNSLIKVPVAPLPAPSPAEALKQARELKIEDELLAMRGERERLDKEEPALVASSKAFERLFNFDIDFAALPPVLDYYLFSVPQKQLPGMKAGWEKHSWHSQWAGADDLDKKDNALILVAVPKGLDCSAAMAGVERIPLPTETGTPRQALLKLAARQADLEGRRRQLEARKREMSERYYPLCVRLEETLTHGAEAAQTAARFGQSAECFYMEGWLKPDEQDRLINESRRLLGGQVAILPIDAHEHQGSGMPTVLQNPPIAGPFQFLVEFLGLPQANEIDPSLILLFTIPILYGMIVGDVGYALLSLLLAYLISRIAARGQMLWQFCRVWMLGAIPSILFGIAFDEYFGYSHAKFLPLLGMAATPLYHPILNRVEDVPTLLLYSIIAGILHIAFGLVLGILNTWNHERKHAYAKMGWLLVEAGGIFAVGHYLLHGFDPTLGLAGALVLIAGSAVIVMTEGPLGLVEIPGLASNIMSYCRIAAVGAGGVILAEAINKFLAPDPAMLATPGGALVFVILALAYALAHAANTGLAMFESFIHGARLNVVEFFGKFFHGGGQPFKPFAARRKYTSEASLS